MRKFILTCVLLALGALVSFAQSEVRIGNTRFVPEQNVRPARRVRGASHLELGVPVGGKLNVLVQLSDQSTSEQRLALRKKGVELLGYVDGNAYYATVPVGSRPSDFVGMGLSSLVPIQDGWRLGSWLQEDPLDYPEWADRGDGVAIQLYWFTNANEQDVRAGLDELSAKEVELYPSLHAALAVIPKDRVLQLSHQSWLRYADVRMPQQQLLNAQARVLSGASWLQHPVTYAGGAGLTGNGVRIGIWDGNVQLHPDYGKRVTRMEYESSVGSSGGHGMHVTGSVLGSGLLIHRGQGMAYKAKSWNWNFNISSNGLREFDEMEKTYQSQHISLTQNSYGLLLANVCQYYNSLSYFALGAYNIDNLACQYPKLTHVFAAGNNQGNCGYIYGSMTGRAKNVIYVGAVTAEGEISSFSSLGPMDDGRLSPTVCAKGVNVFSTMPDASYSLMSGTSMACPVTTGHLALLTERYGQLFPGQVPTNTLLKALVANTADDMGRPGPDYQYGYGILNGVQALTALNNAWYAESSFAATDSQKAHTIQVPDGVKALRVMLVWNDPAPSALRPYGESVLVNDLDLSVAYASKIAYPYVLDPKHPEANATTGIDHLNNVEQVVIANPKAGECSVYINGAIREGDAQPYTLCWFFDYGKSALYYPMGGEVFEPGETIMVRTQNMTGVLQYEILDPNYASTGVKKSVHVSGASPMHVEELALPKRAGQYILRVSDSQSNLEQSAPFTVVPTPKNVVLKGEPCDYSTWTLSWDAVPKATRYRVLKANLDTEEYETVATVAGSETSFSLAGKVSVGERNLFSVQAEVASLWGNRSVAILSNTYSFKPVTTADLPLLENFDVIPLQSAQLQAGDSLTAILQDTPPQISRKKGSHLWYVFANTNAQDWKDPFSNSTHLASMRVCHLDLTGIQAGTKLVFSIYSLLMANEPEDTQYRLLVDGQVIPDMLGQKVDMGTQKQVERTWDFTPYAGQKISIEVQAALRQNGSRFYLIYYRLNQPIEKTDVMINRLAGVSSGPNLGAVTASVNVVNNSYNPVANVPVLAYVNGVEQAAVNAKDLKPYESRTLQFPLDLSVSNPEGDILNVEVVAKVEGDIDLSDNRIRRRIMNFGQVVPCARTEFYATSQGTFPVNPNAIEYVKDKVLFADMGGLQGGYEPGQLSTMQFRPSTPGQVLQVRFIKWDLGESTSLNLFTKTMPYNSEMRSFNAERQTASYTLEGQSSTPLEPILSNAEDGSLTFFFESNPQEEQDNYGYVAEIREVYPTNLLTLAPLTADAHYPTQQMVSTIQITSNVALPLNDVKVEYGLEGSKKHTQTLPLLRANSSTEVTLEDAIELPFPSRGIYRVHVFGKDPMQKDNVQEIELYNDYPGFFKPGKFAESQCLGIKSIAIPGQWKPNYTKFSDHLIYNTGRPLFSFYQNDPVTMTVYVTEVEPDMLPASLYVWFDADLSHTFSFTKSAPFFQKVPLEEGKEAYELNFDLSSIQDFEAGARRMRIALLKDNEFEAFTTANMATCGYALDILADVKAGHAPEVRDMAITELSLVNQNGDRLVNGPNLPNNAKAKIKLTNFGNTPVSEVPIKVLLDGNQIGTTTVTQTIPPYGVDSIEVTLGVELDLSQSGSHTVRIELLDPQGDVDEYNNHKQVEIFCTYPQATDALYAMKFEPGQKLAFGRNPGFIQGLEKTDYTIETWFKLDPKWREAAARRFVAPIFLAEGILVAASYGASDIPPNSIMIVVGSNFNAIYTTSANLVSDETWTHIALELERKPVGKGFYHEPHLYINGESIPLHTDSKESRWSTAEITYPELGVNSYLGEIKMFRIWEGLRTSTELKETMAKSVAASEPANLRTEFMMNEGQSFYVSGYHGAIGRFELDPYGREYTSDEIWADISDHVIGEVGVTGQPIPATQDNDGNYILTAPHSLASKSQVPMILQGAWPTEANYTVASTPFQAGDMVDFDNLEQKVDFTVEYTHLFGDVHISKSGVAKLLVDKSSGAELKTIVVEKSNNSTLTATETQTVTSPNITLQLDGLKADLNQLKAVKMTVQDLSEDATVLYGTQKAGKGELLTVDFTSPIVLTVVSANGRFSNAYSVSLAKGAASQTIDENSTANEQFTFSDKPLQGVEDLFTPANADYEYLIFDPAVILQKDGKFYARKVGTTGIQARLLATATTSQVVSLIRDIEVLPAPVTITPKMENRKVGDPIPDLAHLEFEVTGVQYDDDITSFKTPEYQLLDAMDQPVDANKPMAEGTYKLAPLHPSYAEGNYTVTLATKEFQVVANPDAIALTLHVVDQEDAAVENADVQIGNYSFMTDASGEVSVTLAPETYSVQVSKTGYLPVQEEVMATTTPLTQKIILKKQTISLTYVASANGSIAGKAAQMLSPGENGTPVTAVPDLGYTFIGWEDGVSTATRLEENVTVAQEHTATFGPIELTAKYLAWTGATVKANEAEQTVLYGHAPNPVTLKLKPGYAFLGWSDGVTTLTRQDPPITENLEVVAYTYPFYALPISHDFEDSNEIPEFWSVWTHPFSPRAFTVVDKQNYVRRANGHAVGFIGTNTLAGIKTSLTSPWISLEGVTEDITVSYDLFVKIGNNPDVDFYLQYRTNENDDFTDLTFLNAKKDLKFVRQEAIVKIADLAGKEKIQFQWLTSLLHADVALDNIEISTPNPTQFNTLYLAGGNGMLRSPFTDETLSDRIVQVVHNGELSEAVTAVPNPGFRFVKWSDGVTDARRLDGTAVNVTAYFALDLPRMVQASYLAVGGGAIQGLSIQSVPVGGDAEPVTAKPMDGFRFLHWSDGSTNPTRMDKAMTESKSLIAYFSKKQFVMVYQAQANGELVGSMEQYLGPGESGSAVYAQPAAGYHFVRWSDGRTDNPRIDKDIQESAIVTAEFAEGAYTILLSVLDEDGKPLSGVTVSFASTNSTTEATTDSKGQASLVVNGKGDYAYTLTRDGYQPLNGNAQVEEENTVMALLLKRNHSVSEVHSTLLMAMRVMPNPFTNVLRLEGVQSLYKVELIAMDGRTMMSALHNGSSQLQLNTQTLPTGSYLLRAIDLEGKSRVITVVKQR